MKWLLLAAGMMVAAPAMASDKRDFETCDGRVHPGKQADGLRGEATQSSVGGLGSSTANTIAACTRALESPRLLPTQTLRKAHLLRARAAAWLKAGDAAKALADLDLAEAAVADRASDRFHQRSMGVSLQLLRSLALAQSDALAKAAPLARAAMAARPYALHVQLVGAQIVHAARPMPDTSGSPLDAALRLDPSLVPAALKREAEFGNFGRVVEIGTLLKPDWPEERLKPLSLMVRDRRANRLISTAEAMLDLAYARAATGDVTGARRDVGEVRARVEALKPLPDPASPGLKPTFNETLDQLVEVRSRQVDFRIAVAEQRAGEVLRQLGAVSLPVDAVTVELMSALRTSLPRQDAQRVPDPSRIAAQIDRGQLSMSEDLVDAILIAPETPRAVVDYERARPNILGAIVNGALTMGFGLLGGIDRTDGFRSTTNPDGTVKVEFIGATPSAPMVQEMTLLRAAELARAAGKAGFVIVERSDYQRIMRTLQYGSEISRVNAGYKTELTIRFVDAGIEPQRAFDATAIIDALGPLYYQAKPGRT